MDAGRSAAAFLLCCYVVLAQRGLDGREASAAEAVEMPANFDDYEPEDFDAGSPRIVSDRSSAHLPASAIARPEIRARAVVGGAEQRLSSVGDVYVKQMDVSN
jgi:hypothetical protein